ncbi:zinc-dependent alcohol dehydrogenase family protein [Aspergillus saccharolyticus JOP 1030-1]|uniref:Zinc-type alcohol dehydrogenase-like protein n=1 Tax=Aspergillus saccharolyticus JOP 1030-1 TaxID=1450539 RepID=A0A318ZQ21_9EURO|nr:zinc-type alcohol dehydrogenase-like protein [Aspergillus saccharolyticus JOP 1030-1]PYH48644.1 zinc-type alcohol dehydrogenase-like protein [Aspergillus saccharolyticus JOP 1030-1]
MASATMKQWTIDHPDKDMEGLRLEEVSLPSVSDYDVLVKFEAAALNYRDAAIAKGTFPFAHKYPIVPVSDGAGVVIEVGSRVREFSQGDRVITVFNQGHQYGDIDPYAASTGVGGTIDGCFRQFGVYSESGLVKSPKNLTALESSTLPGAALTSWNALYGLRPIKAGQWVLVQGTGGVAISGLQLAKAAGATVIATTSSEEKATKLRASGADHVINYRDQPNWGEVARRLTPGQAGIDYILDIGGTNTLDQSLKCIKMEGIINLIGFLGGSDQSQPGFLDALSHICTVRGLYVGSRAMLKDMVQAFEANNIRPVLDSKVFTLEQGKEALEYLAAQKHFSKVVVKID